MEVIWLESILNCESLRYIWKFPILGISVFGKYIECEHHFQEWIHNFMSRKKFLKIPFGFSSDEPRKHSQRKKYELVFDSLIFF